jgi:hypothetical protein
MSLTDLSTRHSQDFVHLFPGKAQVTHREYVRSKWSAVVTSNSHRQKKETTQ